MSRRERHVALALFLAAYAGVLALIFAPQGYFLHKDKVSISVTTR